MLEDVSIIIPLAPGENAHEVLLEDLKNTKAEIILSSEGNRAKSLNAGASKSQNQFLWFLHADTRITKDNLTSLERALRTNPSSLHYFDLKFDDSGLSVLNACGANIRSHLFGLPFGDQGFCISKDQFEKLGAYPEDVSYGEDLLFIRQAKRAGMPLNPVSSELITSACKYKEQGWLKLTLARQWQFYKLMGQKL